MEAVLAALRARFDGTERGLLLLVGESGVGKTRVVAEVAQRLAGADFEVLVGEALPADQQPAALQLFLGPLRAIADLCREGGPEVTERLLGARGPVLGLYEPAIADLFAGSEGQIRSRRELFGALGRTLSVLAEERSTALILDDVQFADELSLSALRFLSGPEGPAVILLGTCRTEDRRAAIDELLDLEGVLSFELGRLDVGAVGQIAAEMLGLSAAPAGLAESLGRRSDGNPLYVAEYLRGAVEAGLLGRDESGRWDVRPDISWDALPMPQSLRQLLQERFVGLTSDEVAVVELAAVFGRSVPADLLAGSNRGAALAAVVRRGLLTEGPPDSLRFPHDQLREAAYGRITAQERPSLHQRAAEALSATGAPRGETARHWEAAGNLRQARLDYAAGGHDATELYAWEQAEALLRRAVELSDEADALAVRARTELGGRVLHAVGRYEEAEGLVRRAWAEAEDLGVPELEALAARALGTILRDHGAAAEALTVVEASLRLATAAGDPALEATALGNLATLKIDAGDFEGSIELGERALRAHRASGGRRSEGITLGNLAAAHGRAGRLDEARRLLQEALAVHRSIGNRLSEGIALDNLAFVHLEQGRHQQALAALSEALEVHREVGSPLMEGHCLRNMGIAWARQGDVRRARALLQEALALHRRIEHEPGADKTLAELSRLDGQEP